MRKVEEENRKEIWGNPMGDAAEPKLISLTYVAKRWQLQEHQTCSHVTVEPEQSWRVTGGCLEW